MGEMEEGGMDEVVVILCHLQIVIGKTKLNISIDFCPFLPTRRRGKFW